MGEARTANAVDRKLGERVRRRRLELDMSQERLAELLGVTFQQVQKYEKGINRIAASRLFDISVALDMSIEAWFEGLAPRGAGKAGNGKKSPFSDARKTFGTDEGYRLMGLFASIENVRVRKRLLHLAQALVEDEDKAP